METRANYVAIGIFVLAVIFGVFGFIYWLAKTADTGARQTAIIEFDGSVTGLSEGALVLFNGIKVGEVKTLALNREDPTKVQAIVSVDSTAPLKRDTKAVLGFQGLTGVAHVELKGGSAGAAPLFDGGAAPIIKADRSAFQNLIEGAQSVLTRADKALEVVEEIVVKNRDSIDRSIANVETFSDALAKNSEGVDKFLSEVSRAADALSGLSDNLETLITHADDVVKAIDPEKVSKTVDNVTVFTDSLAGAAKDVDSVIADFRKTADELTAFGENLNKTLAKADKVIAGVDPDKVSRVVDNVDRFTTNLSEREKDIGAIIDNAKAASENVASFTDNIAAKKADVDQIVADAREFADRLNAISVRIDSVIGKVEGMVEGNGEGFFAEATAAAKAIRTAAETFASRADSISSGLERLSTRGVRDFEAMMNQGRRTLTTIERTFSDFDKQPNRVIFGGSNRPTYQRR